MRVPSPRRRWCGGLALVLASSGTTLAASRYLVTSTSQIKPACCTRWRTARGEINEATSPWVLAKPGFPAVWGASSARRARTCLGG